MLSLPRKPYQQLTYLYAAVQKVKTQQLQTLRKMSFLIDFIFSYSVVSESDHSWAKSTHSLSKRQFQSHFDYNYFFLPENCLTTDTKFCLLQVIIDYDISCIYLMQVVLQEV